MCRWCARASTSTSTADGHSNWAVADRRAGARARPKAQPPGRGPSFSQIRISDGTMVVRDAAHDITETLTDVDLALAWPVDLEEFRRHRPASCGTTSRSTPAIAFGDFLAALTGEPLGPEGAPRRRADEDRLRRQHEHAARRLQDRRHARGRRAVAARDHALDRQQAAARRRIRPLRAEGQDQRGRRRTSRCRRSISSSTAMSPKACSAMRPTAGGRWQGTLAVEALDLTPYVSTVRLLTSNSRDWNRMPIVLDGLTGIDLDLRLSAARVVDRRRQARAHRRRGQSARRPSRR